MILQSKQQKEQDDETKWAQTEQVFEAPNVDFNKHQWVQQGYAIIDMCPTCPRQSIPIPSGKMLIKKEGSYSIVDELRG